MGHHFIFFIPQKHLSCTKGLFIDKPCFLMLHTSTLTSFTQQTQWTRQSAPSETHHHYVYICIVHMNHKAKQKDWTHNTNIKQYTHTHTQINTHRKSGACAHTHFFSVLHVLLVPSLNARLHHHYHFFFTFFFHAKNIFLAFFYFLISEKPWTAWRQSMCFWFDCGFCICSDVNVI